MLPAAHLPLPRSLPARVRSSNDGEPVVQPCVVAETASSSPSRTPQATEGAAASKSHPCRSRSAGPLSGLPPQAPAPCSDEATAMAGVALRRRWRTSAIASLQRPAGGPAMEAPLEPPAGTPSPRPPTLGALSSGSKGDRRRGNSSAANVLQRATREVTGWLLGAILATFDGSRLGSLAELLEKHQHGEMELLRNVLLEYLGENSAAPLPLAVQAQFYTELLHGLHAYVGDEEADPQEIAVRPDASSTVLLGEFFAHIWAVVRSRHKRSALGDQKPGEQKAIQRRGGAGPALPARPLQPRRRLASDPSAPLDLRVPKRRRTEKEAHEEQRQLLHVEEHSDPRVGLVPEAARQEEEESELPSRQLQEATAFTAPGGAMQEEAEASEAEAAWPEGNGTCDACGRFDYDCMPYGKEAVILCALCRKAKHPLLLVLASECFRLHSNICGRPGGA